MAGVKHLENWGRAKARERYAPGGSVPFSKWHEERWGIKDAKSILDGQDVGGGTGANPYADPRLSKLKRDQEMDDYIPKRTEANP